MSQTNPSNPSLTPTLTAFQTITRRIREGAHINVIKALIARNPDVIHQFTSDKYTLLDIAICFRDDLFIQDLIKTYNLPLTFPSHVKHNPYIFHAYEHKKYDVLSVLLNMGADPNEKDVDGIPLLITVATEGNLEALNILLKRDININITDIDSCNAAIYAARHHKMDVLDMLIGRGIDINHQSNCGSTPLMHAAIGNSFGCLKMLVQNGAELNAKDNDGLTAINYAELGMKNNTKPSRMCLDYLIEHGAQKYIEYDDVKKHTTILSSETK